MSGEKIEFVVRISNNSYRKIKPLKVTLFETMTYLFPQNGCASFKCGKCFLSNNISIEPLQDYEWNDTNNFFYLPTLCPSLFETCRIMKRKYFLRLEVSPSHSSPFYLRIPITIGNFYSICKYF